MVDPYMIFVESIFEFIYLALWVLEWVSTCATDRNRTNRRRWEIGDFFDIILIRGIVLIINIKF